MKPINEINENIPQWLNEEEACCILNIKPKTLRQKCSKGEFCFKIEQSGTKHLYYINVSSLTDNIQKEYLKKFKDFRYNQDSYSDAPVWAKVQADKYINILNACENLTGKSLIDFVANGIVTIRAFKHLTLLSEKCVKDIKNLG